MSRKGRPRSAAPTKVVRKFEFIMLREALSQTLDSLPESFQTARAELLELLQRSGILYRSETQQVLSRDGTSARWMLDSLAVTLSPRGAQLAGRCVLELLKRFDGRQIATYGLTGVPILQSSIVQDSSYRGLLVRKERKEHGSLKLIEGIIDPAEPVILIDDSVSSGTCMSEAIERLEAAGLRVEGGICLVRFGWQNGYALMQERGYHMEAVYDIWDDFIAHMDDEEKQLANPSKWFPPFEWHTQHAPEHLHPAQLARAVISEYLLTGKLLRSPEHLDKKYDSAGGAWVSIRSRESVYRRFARGGFWHFPGEQSKSAADDVVMASLSTAAGLPGGEEGLKTVEQSALAVTFFSALEQCTPGKLDNDRYGIVVRSLERRAKMGGALPRMPGIVNEWAQFQHARIKNAKLVSFEPYELFRHEVVKVVEPGATWQPTGVPAPEGVPWHKNRSVCGPIVKRARDLVLAQLLDRSETTEPLLENILPKNVDSLYLTIYINGHLRGCMGQKLRSLDDDLKSIAKAAVRDERFAGRAAINSDSVAVTVSFLSDPLPLGEASAAEVVNYYRHGDQTVMVYQEDRVGLLLPFVASCWNLDPVGFANAVIEKAGLKEPPYYWVRFDCATWLADREGISLTVGGFAPRQNALPPVPELVTHQARIHLHYLLKHLREDGSFYSGYQPFHNRLYESPDLARQAHGAWALARAVNIFGGNDLKSASNKVIDSLLTKVVRDGEEVWLQAQSETATVAESSFLLLALSCLPDHDTRRELMKDLAATLWRCVELPHGRIFTHNNSDEPSPEPFQDYFPGQVLLALAVACEAKVADIDAERLRRSFQYYRHRFRYKRHFGQATWLMQAFSKWFQVTGEVDFASLAFEVADWLLGYQQDKTGGFSNDHQPGTPGYTTAVYLEGIASAMLVASSLADTERHRRYYDSLATGFAFLDRLIIQDRDQSILPNPDFAIGGLRQGVHYSEVRTDFVQHSLSAILEFWPRMNTDN
ncbi:MAG TPA: AMMECR1 domain-containing protein [Pyrinomonadaceae bacterium]|nr:AMMECR1 domain-containing protein [Pyrinomonadaceae bacterium]